VRNALGILCGLNREFHPGKIKGARFTFDRLGIAPPRIGERLESLSAATPASSVAEAAALAEELYDLVARERPDIDLTRARQRFGIVLRR